MSNIIPDAFATTKKKFGQLDIVCNNAGIMHEGHWETMLDINLVSEATNESRLRLCNIEVHIPWHGKKLPEWFR